MSTDEGQTTDVVPTTDCPACGRSARDCNASKAKGWDNCCQTCDAAGNVTTHRLRVHELPIGGSSMPGSNSVHADAPSDEPGGSRAACRDYTPEQHGQEGPS